MPTVAFIMPCGPESRMYPPTDWLDGVLMVWCPADTAMNVNWQGAKLMRVDRNRVIHGPCRFRPGGGCVLDNEGKGMKDIADEREHVFIAGTGRCGTTLLASILFNSGAYAVYRAESKLLDECPPKYGSLASDRAYRRFCRDWFNSRQFHRSGLSRAEFDAAVSGCRGSYAKMLGAFMGAMASRQNKELWVDDTPSNAFRLPEISRDFPNSRVIHIVRDGRAVALSLTKLGWTGVHTDDYRKGLCYSALKWEQSLHAIIDTKHCLHDRYLEIKYEDLVSNPSMIIEVVCGFLGIEYALEGLTGAGGKEVIAGRSQSALLSANTAFGDVGYGISSKPAYRWREQIAPEDQAMVESYIGSTLRHYGYPVTHSQKPGLLARVTRDFRAAVLGSKRALKYHTWLGRITPTPLEINQQ